MYKVIVAGSRNITNEQYIYDILDVLIEPGMEIVSGCAKGVDTVALDYAKDNGIPYEEFPAEWDKHGKQAGPIRNREMGLYADNLVAFWDGKSSGTKHMIDFMIKLDKPVVMIYVPENQRDA